MGAHGEPAARQRAGINAGHVDLPVWHALKLRRRGCRTPRFPTGVPSPVRGWIFRAHSLRNKPSGLEFPAQKSRALISEPSTCANGGCDTARTGIPARDFKPEGVFRSEREVKIHAVRKWRPKGSCTRHPPPRGLNDRFSWTKQSEYIEAICFASFASEKCQDSRPDDPAARLRSMGW